jgi:hypothetical protein
MHLGSQMLHLYLSPAGRDWDTLLVSHSERPKASQSIGEDEEATNTWWGIVILERY